MVSPAAKWLLPAAEQIGYQRGNAVGIKIVVQWVIAVRRCETDFDLVGGTPVTPQDALHVPTEVPFHFEDQRAEFARLVTRREAQ